MDVVLRERGRCGLPRDELCAVSAVVQPAAPRYLVLTQPQARSHRAAGARYSKALIHQAGTGIAKHDQPRRAGLAPDSPARAWMSSGVQVQMMTSADGLLGTPGPIQDSPGQRGSIDDGIGVRCAEIGELTEDV